jgi:uncharacterized protein (TIGR00255 family)
MPMNSMTGFGRAELVRKEYQLQIEISSVNSRFLEMVFRMPRLLAGVESQMKDLISAKVIRGKLTVTVNLEESPGRVGTAAIDPDITEAYYRQLVRLKKRLGIAGEIEFEDVIAHPELLVNPAMTLNEKRLWPDLKRLVNRALADLVKMRRDEGRNLARDITSRLRRTGQLIAVIEKGSHADVVAYKKRLERRLKELDNGIQIDPQRLAEEMTMYADRSDVTEECIRVRSHIALFRETLNNAGEIGKRMNFIIQEMGREANTISAKALSSATATAAIALKEEIEKLREQAQNIE